MFNNGLIVGRFEHIHKGHELMINEGLKHCHNLLVFVSSDEVDIKNDPLDVNYRIELMKRIYQKELEEGRLLIKEYNSPENIHKCTHKWGTNVLNSAKCIANNDIDCIIYGSDKLIENSFCQDDINKLHEIKLSRNILNISGTSIREFIVNDDKKSWQQYVNPCIYNEFDSIREKILYKYSLLK